YHEAATGGEALLLTLRAAAAAVLRANDAGRWTIPASRIYPHQWNWDSALCSLGWAEIDPGRAWTELESLVGGRARDGMLPHIAGPLHEWHRFLLRERDPDGLGEPVLIHPWESGRDNAPEWDRPLFRVEPRLMYVRRRDTAHIDAAERPSAEHYKRYLTLVV